MSNLEFSHNFESNFLFNLLGVTCSNCVNHKQTQVLSYVKYSLFQSTRNSKNYGDESEVKYNIIENVEAGLREKDTKS